MESPKTNRCRFGQRQGTQNRILAVFFAVACGFVLLIVSGASAQLGPKDGADLSATDLERVKVGDTAPDFTLENMDGRRITLSSVYRDKKTILVFYRGQW